MGQIIRDERYTNTLWCLCNNYDEYLQFAKDLYLYKGLVIYGELFEDVKWFDNIQDWYCLFGIKYRNRK